jgi:hypothetical protein
MNDTGMNVPESVQTLRAQQEQLLAGRRLAQMFPLGTKELSLPDGFERVETPRGVFHFHPTVISKREVRWWSSMRRENALLGLGPYNKEDIVGLGEPILTVTERTPDGVEVKAAAGTQSTLPAQLTTFEKLKTPGNIVTVEDLPMVLAKRK